MGINFERERSLSRKASQIDPLSERKRGENMNAIERIDRALDQWAQSLRGHTPGPGLQPKDVLHRILHTLEENRIEGLDNQLYAPNAYEVILHLAPEEQQRLLPFLGREELEAAITRYCQEHKYHFRGPLTVQVREEPFPRTAPETAQDKVQVVCRYQVSESYMEEADADQAKIYPLPTSAPVQHREAAEAEPGLSVEERTTLVS